MATKATHYAVDVIVESTKGYDFPLDMLRYDNCVPATEEDANRMGRDTTKGQRVRLVRYVLRGTNVHADQCRTAIARWESRGWRMLHPTEVEFIRARGWASMGNM